MGSVSNLQKIVDMMIADNFPSAMSRDAARRKAMRFMRQETPTTMARLERQASKLTEEEMQTLAGGEDIEMEEIDRDKGLGALSAFLSELFEEL